MKILVVEDDENSRQLLETVLTAKGYEVASFDNGLKALSHLQTQDVNLIISDILMPEMDGYGLCRAVKQNQNLQHIPLIFYTATYTSEQDKKFALSLGATKFLIKPMLMPELMDIIDEVLNSNGPADLPRSRGLYRGSPLKLDKQHADRVRSKLDQKIIELSEEREKLIASEARFRDFAEASADWFWESDEYLKIFAVTGGPKGLSFYSLTDLAEASHSHSSNEMLKTLQGHKRFSDYVVHFTDEAGKLVYLRVSGKPVFANNGNFVGYRGVGRDVSETIALNRKVEFLASHDELTGLPNRSMFRQRLEHAVTKAARTGNQVLLLFFDLDHFKMVNDTLGHEVGDQLLIMATKRITERVRATDVLCRLGGDEFVMIMEGASPQDGHRLVRDIIAAFSVPFEMHQQKVYSTVSIGVSVYPDDTTDTQTLLVYADLAMYRAKQNGRNDFEFYTTNLNFIAHQWLEMEHGIRHALKEKQLFIMYQPQLENTHNQLIGMEALIRWRHPERGLIPPLEFIKIAEQSSLINQIGEWVLEATCKQMRAWLDKKFNVPRVSINISARHLRSDNLIKMLNAIPAKYAITPSMLCIEITEYALLEEVDVVKNNMRLIKDLGFHISLDDFGMGHSSLLYLKRWAVDEVKIDRSFVDGLVNSEEDRVIVKAIVALGDALGLDLVAEGVENQEQADILITSGCKKVQGYFYSPPLEAKEMETWLKK
ncbi:MULTISPECIES: two-component system response regulator [Methylotenera]|uniref:two-component system response regulator n=1 Tax=Methylotenera TaxID=359407 RepID=UPI0003693417|nr:MULTISPECIES: EAL domain-containing protein [Methylotenera]